VQEYWNYTKLDDLFRNNDHFECIFVEIPKFSFSQKNVIIGVIYRPPNTDIHEFNQMFSDLLSEIQREDKLIYLMGDFNVNLLNAGSHNASAEFLDTFYSNGLIPLITKPTRIQNQSATIIDNIFCNQVYDNKMFSGIFYTDISDHLPIFTICLDKRISSVDTSYKSRDFSYKNLLEFHKLLNDCNWQSIIDNTDCQEAFTLFHRSFKSKFDKCFPLKERKSNYASRKSWLTAGIKNSIKIKNKLYIKYKKNPTQESHSKYKTYRNKLTSLMRSTEKN